MEDLDGLRGLILYSQAQHINYSLEGEAGAGVDIGVADTIYETNIDNITVVDSTCCLEEYRDDPPATTAPHGKLVLPILHYYAEKGDFYLYLAGDEREVHTSDGTIEERTVMPQMAFGDAVKAAISDEIDILNLSAGKCRPRCINGECQYCNIAKRALDKDIAIVAAAGNNSDGVIHCPANRDQVICVAGFEVECGYTDRDRRAGGGPEGAYWTKMWSGVDYPDGAVDGQYCSMRGCDGDSQKCERHRDVEPWENNPQPSGEKPDILGPVHYAHKMGESKPFVWAASSFAAPVVSGAIAGVISRTSQSEISPHTLRESVVDSGDALPSGHAPTFNAEELEQTMTD